MIRLWEIVRRPVAEANGESTRISAVSPEA